MLFYRRLLATRSRVALAFFSSTELPMVVAITTIAVARHRMTTVTAAALVGAGVLSTLVYPIIAVQLRGDHYEPEGPEEGLAELQSAAPGAAVA